MNVLLAAGRCSLYYVTIREHYNKQYLRGSRLVFAIMSIPARCCCVGKAAYHLRETSREQQVLFLIVGNKIS
jgi:hypothetical protein